MRLCGVVIEVGLGGWGGRRRERVSDCFDLFGGEEAEYMYAGSKDWVLQE